MTVSEAKPKPKPCMGVCGQFVATKSQVRTGEARRCPRCELWIVPHFIHYKEHDNWPICPCCNLSGTCLGSRTWKHKLTPEERVMASQVLFNGQPISASEIVEVYKQIMEYVGIGADNSIQNNLLPSDSNKFFRLLTMLEQLSPTGIYTTRKLLSQTGGWSFQYLKEAKRQGLVESKVLKEPGRVGRPLTYHTLTEQGTQVLSGLKKTDRVIPRKDTLSSNELKGALGKCLQFGAISWSAPISSNSENKGKDSGVRQLT